MCGQWIWSGGMESRRMGFNYASLPSVYEGLEIRKKDRPELYRGLKVMERAALGVMNDQ